MKVTGWRKSSNTRFLSQNEAAELDQYPIGVWQHAWVDDLLVQQFGCDTYDRVAARR